VGAVASGAQARLPNPLPQHPHPHPPASLQTPADYLEHARLAPAGGGSRRAVTVRSFLKRNLIPADMLSAKAAGPGRGLWVGHWGPALAMQMPGVAPPSPPSCCHLGLPRPQLRALRAGSWTGWGSGQPLLSGSGGVPVCRRWARRSG
jgi:hypothetical protein